ncbi:MAG: Rieske (2Fe-2S) protein, partial [Nitrososphaerales archaeon]
CHWHHARFDLATGGTFDLFADDVQVYKTLVSGGRVLVKMVENGDDLAKVQSATLSHVDRKLKEGLEHSLNLVIAKSIIQELYVRPKDQGAKEILKLTSEFGTLNRLEGWGPGLTILSCMSNLLDHLTEDDTVSALVQAASHVSSDCFGEPARRRLVPLSGDTLLGTEQRDFQIVKRWFREFVDQREPEAAERALLSAIRLFSKEEIAEILFSAITDHTFINGGHSFDFTNKAFELLDEIGWEHAETILPSLVRNICNAQRREEDSEWRSPIDLFSLVLDAEKKIPALLLARGKTVSKVNLEALVGKLLSDEPKSVIHAIEEAISIEGCSVRDASLALACAAATRLARFHIQNEFGDWITVLHSLSYCNAVLQSTRFLKDDETILRAIFQGAMNLYLTRFLNIPSANLPEGNKAPASLQQAPLLDELLASIEHKDVDRSAVIVSEYLKQGFETEALFGALIHSVVREDAEFHTFQLIEATIRTLDFIKGHDDIRRVILIGAARYIAAHSPTDRSLPQTIKIAQRLQRGEALYEQ